MASELTKPFEEKMKKTLTALTVITAPSAQVVQTPMFWIRLWWNITVHPHP